MIKKIVLILTLILLALPIVNATVDDIRFYGEQSQTLNLKEQCFNDGTYCSGASTCNITIYEPDMNLLINNQLMTNKGSHHNYTLNSSSTSILGVYEATAMCEDGTEANFDTFYYQITFTGNPPPSDTTKLGFMLGFIVILCLMVITIINVTGHTIKLDTDFKDVAYSFCIYFSVLALKSFNLTYGNNSLIDTFSNLFIKVGAFTHILFPLIALVLTFTLGKLKRFKAPED